MARIALTAMGLALIRSLWAGLGPPWRWPLRFLRAVDRRVGRVIARTRNRFTPALTDPDPFVVLQVQHRLGLIASELQVLEAAGADLTYYARAHRIHTRRSAYDQLLVEACELAGVPARPCRLAAAPLPHPGPFWNADERFSAEMELAARGWHW